MWLDGHSTILLSYYEIMGQLHCSGHRTFPSKRYSFCISYHYCFGKRFLFLYIAVGISERIVKAHFYDFFLEG